MGCFSSRVETPTEELPGPPAVERDAPTPADTAAPTQPDATLPSATDLGVDKRQLLMWRRNNGDSLEPVLASGAVALLDAQWIISHAEAGGVLTHRQALPKEAFLSLADLVEACFSCNSALPVAALSYPWLTKDHPDPCGANLSRVARVLKLFLGNRQIPLSRLGVFWDFGSLHQHPDPVNGVMRTEEQNALFKQGLGCLGTLYSHPHTFVLRLTSFPDGHKAEDQAEGTNVAKYFDRGWCATENAWASLTKRRELSLDLGLMRDGKEYDFLSLMYDCIQHGGRRPPLLPSQFAAELETKSFTNGKDDKPLVKRLYEAAFEEQFGKVTELHYAELGWGDAGAAQLAEVLASGAAPRLETLNLLYNEIGDEGCQALAAALKGGAAPSLKRLEVTTELAAIYREQVPPVYYQKTTENGTYCYVGGTPECEALVAVCEERGIELPMDLYYSSASRSKLGGAEAAQLAGVIASGAAPRLEALSLFHNQIGNTGCMALAAALAKEGAAPRLKQLDLRSNKIGDEGCDALAAALGKEGAAPRLDQLSLGDNEIGDEGCKALAAALGKEGAAPRLEYLGLRENKIGDEGCDALAAALKEGAAPSLKTLGYTRQAAVAAREGTTIVCDVGNEKQPELMAVCEERGIKLL